MTVGQMRIFTDEVNEKIRASEERVAERLQAAADTQTDRIGTAVMGRFEEQKTRVDEMFVAASKSFEKITVDEQSRVSAALLALEQTLASVQFDKLNLVAEELRVQKENARMCIETLESLFQREGALVRGEAGAVRGELVRIANLQGEVQSRIVAIE